MARIYYQPDTGIIMFQYLTKNYPDMDLPYMDLPEPINAESVRVDVTTGQLVPYSKPARKPKPVIKTYQEQRRDAYNPIPEQLDQLFHDISNGHFGSDAKNSEWYQNIQAVKSQFPKP